ncbi:hypothetical protein N658DRAFT_494370 [Parathielavia hyrcaniae]|uniref:Uncharacterized protein n=1 Tax=Parathielavia hyrcaniae TaxID=113614 RepID=A0AAN6Q6D1_9PEZI|nr:hypothetical protein N658DRAFT_494370 [Parathielavia hyrcaniae]
MPCSPVIGKRSPLFSTLPALLTTHQLQQLRSSGRDQVQPKHRHTLGSWSSGFYLNTERRPSWRLGTPEPVIRKSALWAVAPKTATPFRPGTPRAISRSGIGCERSPSPVPKAPSTSTGAGPGSR